MILRPMTMSDADKMLEWKNYPETRQFAIASHEEIKREDHLKWLEKNLQYFQVIDDCKGAVRVENGEISIWIDRAFRGHGLAGEVINAVSFKGMRAKIVDGNIASMKTFIRAGYLPEEYVKVGIEPNKIYTSAELEAAIKAPNYYIFICR